MLVMVVVVVLLLFNFMRRDGATHIRVCGTVFGFLGQDLELSRGLGRAARKTDSFLQSVVMSTPCDHHIAPFPPCPSSCSPIRPCALFCPGQRQSIAATTAAAAAAAVPASLRVVCWQAWAFCIRIARHGEVLAGGRVSGCSAALQASTTPGRMTVRWTSATARLCANRPPLPLEIGQAVVGNGPSEVCRPLSCPAAACLHQGAHVYCLLCTIVCTYIHVLLTPTRPSTRPVCANRCVRALCGRSLSVSLCALAAPQHPSALSPLSPSPLSLYVYSKGPTPPTNAYRPRHACILLSTATDAHTLSLCCQMDKGCARFPPSPTLGKGVPPPILRVCVCKCVSSLCSSGTCAVRAYSVQYSTVHYIICAVALNLLNLLTTSP